jgi:hypothetical protein
MCGVYSMNGRDKKCMQHFSVCVVGVEGMGKIQCTIVDFVHI